MPVIKVDGKFKIHLEGGRWIYFYYRTTNGIMETKQANNSFASWTVGSIPDGAILC